MILKNANQAIECIQLRKSSSGNSEYWTLIEGTPEWVGAMLYDAHSNHEAGNDSVYEMVYDVLGLIIDNTITSLEDFYKYIHELQPPFHAEDLAYWLADDNMVYLDKAIKVPHYNGIEVLSFAWRLQRNEIADVVWVHINNPNNSNEIRSATQYRKNSYPVNVMYLRSSSDIPIIVDRLKSLTEDIKCTYPQTGAPELKIEQTAGNVIARVGDFIMYDGAKVHVYNKYTFEKEPSPWKYVWTA